MNVTQWKSKLKENDESVDWRRRKSPLCKWEAAELYTRRKVVIKKNRQTFFAGGSAQKYKMIRLKVARLHVSSDSGKTIYDILKCLMMFSLKEQISVRHWYLETKCNELCLYFQRVDDALVTSYKQMCTLYYICLPFTARF